jgi:tetratricopeptide (TPR) repeat protein
MYNLQFDDAHKTFAEVQRQRPGDPMVPVSDVAAYLFAEFDRLHVLESELFVDDQTFESRTKLSPDPAVKRSFDARLQEATKLVNEALARNPKDTNALFAQVMIYGLTGDYLALIEKRDLKALSVVKQGRELADKLLAQDPTCYDAYIAVGIENYLLSQKSAPVRWFLHMTGAQTDKETGLQKLRITAAKGRYLLPYARMLLAVAALRDHQPDQARALLEGLLQEFPHNHLYASELAKLRPPGNFGTQ